MRVALLQCVVALGLVAWPAAAQRNEPATPQVISYKLLPGPPARVVSDRPSFDLGGGATDVDIFNWIVAVRRQGTSLLVATYDPIQIRRFDARGRSLGAFGRKGQGPGEYVDLSELAVLPTDSLVVLDRMQRRLTLLGPDGAYAATTLLTPPFAASPFDISVQPLADGTLLIGYAEAPTGAASAKPTAVFQRVGRYTTRGVLIDTVGSFFVGEYFLQATPRDFGGGSAFWDRAFGRRGALVAHGQSVFVGDATALEVRRLDMTGRVIEVHRLAVPPAPLTPAMVARYRADALAKASPRDRPIEERRVAEMPYPDHLPAFRRLAVDARGRLWLQQYVYPGPTPNHWWILDPATRTARNVQLPDGFLPHIIGRADIVGTWEDPDGVEHVRGYRLLP